MLRSNLVLPFFKMAESREVKKEILRTLTTFVILSFCLSGFILGLANITKTNFLKVCHSEDKIYHIIYIKVLSYKLDMIKL